MDLNKLKQNNIREMEVEECKKEIDRTVRELLSIKEKFYNAQNKVIANENRKIDEFLTEELGFVKDIKENFVDYRLENEEVGKIRIEVCNNYLKIQGRENWNKELKELMKVKKVYEDTDFELMKLEGDIFYFVIEDKENYRKIKSKSLVDFIKEQLEEL
ncbi:hypothetical protein QYB74_001091 [Clostridium perfringens]|nr:hypothetical protein [Clostridium perfringens]